MKNSIQQFEQRFPNGAQFFRYVVIGGSTAALELFVFLGLFYAGVWYVVANTAAFIVAAVYGYFMQKRFTFRHTDNRHHIFMTKFFIVVGSGYFLNMLCIYLFIDKLHWNPIIGKCIQLWIVMIWNFIGQKLFTFRTAK